MIFFIFLSLLSHPIYANEKQMDAVEKLFSIFNPSKKSAQKQTFSVETCKIEQKTLMELALLRRPVKTSFKFAKGCDVEGEVELQVSKAFPVQLKVRNLDQYTKVLFTSTLTIGTVEEGIGYKVDLTQGNLSGAKSSVLFQGFYNYIIGIDSSSKASKSEGGEIVIESIDGKKVAITKVLSRNP